MNVVEFLNDPIFKTIEPFREKNIIVGYRP
jgi:hypothetical protein